MSRPNNARRTTSRNGWCRRREENCPTRLNPILCRPAQARPLRLDSACLTFRVACLLRVRSERRSSRAGDPAGWRLDICVREGAEFKGRQTDHQVQGQPDGAVMRGFEGFEGFEGYAAYIKKLSEPLSLLLVQVLRNYVRDPASKPSKPSKPPPSRERLELVLELRSELRSQ